MVFPVNPWQNGPRMHHVSVGPWHLQNIVVYRDPRKSNVSLGAALGIFLISWVRAFFYWIEMLVSSMIWLFCISSFDPVSREPKGWCCPLATEHLCSLLGFRSFLWFLSIPFTFQMKTEGPSHLKKPGPERVRLLYVLVKVIILSQVEPLGRLTVNCLSVLSKGDLPSAFQFGTSQGRVCLVNLGKEWLDDSLNCPLRVPDVIVSRPTNDHTRWLWYMPLLEFRSSVFPKSSYSKSYIHSGTNGR